MFPVCGDDSFSMVFDVVLDHSSPNRGQKYNIKVDQHGRDKDSDYCYSLSQWLNFKLFGITYLVGKIKFKLFFSKSIG